MLASIGVRQIMTSFCYSFDLTNVGQYAVIHKDRHATNKVFRIMHSDRGWRVEDRKSDGHWEDVTCEEGCILSESKKNDVEYFLGGTSPSDTSSECIHNQEFAICSVSKKSGVHNYIFLALVQAPPISLRLKKLEPKNYLP